MARLYKIFLSKPTFSHILIILDETRGLFTSSRLFDLAAELLKEVSEGFPHESSKGLALHLQDLP